MAGILPACTHCQSERMQNHCTVECHWARCLDCGLLSILTKEES